MEPWEALLFILCCFVAAASWRVLRISATIEDNPPLPDEFTHPQGMVRAVGRIGVESTPPRIRKSYFRRIALESASD